MIKRVISLFLIISFVLFSASCENKNDKLLTKTYYQYFDTVTTVKIYNSNKDFNKICNSFESNVLKKYNQLFDIYKTYKGISNIKTINDNAGIKKIKIDSELTDFLLCCKKMYQKTNGNVNVCLGPVLKIWHKFRNEGKKVPSLNDLKNANRYSSIENLKVNKEKNTAYLAKKGCSIDVGAIAKGYVADKIYSFLLSKIVKNAIVDFGGNIITVGKRTNGENFSVGITNPDNKSENTVTLKCKNGLIISTSGDYERFYEVNGKKYSHIISPKTLFPTEKNKSVTVISKSGYLADTLSTALFILNYKEGLELVNKYNDCYALIIDSSTKLHYSNGFKKFLK